jgi:hypothetical protein
MPDDLDDDDEGVAVHRIDLAQATLVAAAFLDAPRVSTRRAVRAAYAELGQQVDAWFARLTGSRARRPIRVVHTSDPEPYASGEELAERVRADHVLEVRPARHERDRRHPLLDMSVGGTYDRLRVVHDLVSHAWLGFGFDRHGEFSGWLAEDRLYRGLARWALATELHAEHSVRWTTGTVADHKAALLAPAIVRSSRERGARHLTGFGGGEGRCRARTPRANERV